MAATARSASRNGSLKGTGPGKTRHVALRREVLVYPRIEASDEILEILPLVRGEWESFVRGRGSDLYRIREYLPDDSARHVDWKATAKSGSP